MSVVIPFMDDALIHSPDLSSHLVNMKMTLDAYVKAGLRLSPKKCTFFAKQVDFLGHTVDQEGIRPTESYVQKVQDFPFPKTRR